MSDDAMMRRIGNAIRKRAQLLPGETGATAPFYEQEGREAYEVDFYLPASGTSAHHFQQGTFVAKGNAPAFPANMILLDPGENLAADEGDVASLGFWGSQNVRQIDWGSLRGIYDVTSYEEHLPEVEAATSRTNLLEHLGSFAVTKLDDIAYIVGRPPSIDEQVRFLLTTSKLAYAQALASRIVDIARDLEDVEDDPIQLSDGAVSSLVAFLERNPGIHKPLLAGTSTGDVVAKWTHPERGTLNIYFLPEGKVQYYLATPNPENPEEKDWDSGSTTVGALRAKLQRHQVLSWIGE